MKRVKSNGEALASPGLTAEQCESVNLFQKQILTNPLITDLIFADVLYSELLSFSLVSKAWNVTCRGILVDGFRTYLTFSEWSTPEELEDFYNLISQVVPGHQNPFNGIRVKFDDSIQEWPFSSEPLAELISRIMDQMIQVKFVSFDMFKLDLKSSDFHDIFKTLVIPHLGTIEFLEILNFDGIGNLKTLTLQLSVDSLPNLKELNLKGSQDRLQTATFKKILRACPNLKTLSAVFPYQLPTLRYTNKLHLAFKVRFNFMHLTPKDFNLLREFGFLVKTLEMDQICKLPRNQYEGEFISRLQPLFSTYCQHNLQRLEIELELLVAILLQNTFPALANVKELLCHGGHRWFPCLFKNKAVHFAGFLPNLKSVVLSATTSNWPGRTYGTEHDPESPIISLYKCKVPASLESVRALKLCSCERQAKYIFEPLIKIMDLDELFPLVTKLDVENNLGSLKELLQWICVSWGNVLETLILRNTTCLGFHEESAVYRNVPWQNLTRSKKKSLPFGTTYSDRLSHLRRLELEFCHPEEPDSAGNYVEEEVKVQVTFEPWTGHEVQLIIDGCRAQKRVKRVKSGVSIYDTILSLHSCPRNSEFSLMEEILAEKSIVRTICKMLPTPDLIRCFPVSRSWNTVAREVLHQDRTCTLTIDPMDFLRGPWPPPKLTWLTNGKKLFNSLRIECDSHTLKHYRDDATLKAIPQLIGKLEFTHTLFKELEVTGFNQVSVLESPELVQLKAVMINGFKALVQKLELSRVQKLVTSIEIFERLFRDEDGNLLVPNLTSISFVEPQQLLEHPQVFKRLMEELNILERIEVPFSNKLLPYVSSVGRADCVKHIQLYQFHENESFVGENIYFLGRSSGAMTYEDPQTALGSLLKFTEEHEALVETLCVGLSIKSGYRLFLNRHLHPTTEPVFSRIFQRLCTSSCDSLHTLDSNVSFLHFIFQVITEALRALKKIGLVCYEEELDPSCFLAEIPFSDMAPNLEVVELSRIISISPGNVPSQQPACRSSKDKLPRPCSSVKNVSFQIEMRGQDSEELRTLSPEPWILEYVAGVFPYVTNISFDGSASGSGNGFSAVLGSIWEAWPCLQMVDIFVNNMDAISFECSILGISKEEWGVWGELRLVDVLNCMNYAPSSFSVRNCIDLKLVWICKHIKTELVGTTRSHPYCEYESWSQVYLSRS